MAYNTDIRSLTNSSRLSPSTHPKDDKSIGPITVSRGPASHLLLVVFLLHCFVIRALWRMSLNKLGFRMLLSGITFCLEGVSILNVTAGRSVTALWGPTWISYQEEIWPRLEKRYVFGNIQWPGNERGTYERTNERAYERAYAGTNVRTSVRTNECKNVHERTRAYTNARTNEGTHVHTYERTDERTKEPTNLK